jgi:hypothetical protein
MSQSTGSTDRPRRRWRIVVVLAVAAVLVLAATHVFALSQYDSGAQSGPVAARLASARLASSIEPWNGSFAVRVVTLRALQLFDDTQIDRAYFLLLPYSPVVRGDPFFTQVYQEILAVKGPLDSRKAHVQHGFETSQGALPPGGYQP